MKDKISLETDTRGLRLLKKGRRGLWRAVFSRAGMIALFLLLQILLLIEGFRYLQNFMPHYYTFSLAFTGAMGCCRSSAGFSTSTPKARSATASCGTAMPPFPARPGTACPSRWIPWCISPTRRRR